MSFSNHADAFYRGYRAERVIAKPSNADGMSYSQPDNARVSDVVLSGLGDGDPYAQDAAAITSSAATSFANALTASTTPGAAVVAPPAAVPTPSKLPWILGALALGGFLLLRR